MITVAEVLVLAAALSISPMELISPAGYDEEIEILPGRKIDPLQASRWIDGDLMLDLAGPSADFRSASFGERSGIALMEEHAAVISQVFTHEYEVARVQKDLAAARAGVKLTEAAAADAAGHDNDPQTAATLMAEAEKQREVVRSAEAELAYRINVEKTYREVAARSLRLIRAEMRQRGMILPPLPPYLKAAADDEGDTP